MNAQKFAPSHEGVWGFGTPSFWEPSANRFMSVWKLAPVICDDHPCPFPIEIPNRLILASCPENGTVLDPFSGYGTTAISAAKNGRNAIGCEKHKTYYDRSVCRINRVLDQGVLF